MHTNVLEAAYQANLKENAYAAAWGRKRVRKWALDADLEFATALPDEVLARAGLRESLTGAETPQVMAALILAWGEMKTPHARLAFSVIEEWIGIVEGLCAGTLTGQQAYEEFTVLRHAKRLPGMGPAYFTKLIYFLQQQSSSANCAGFIMDQWTGRSVNLLAGREIVRIGRSVHRGRPTYIVTDSNTAENYACFNSEIVRIGKRLGCSGELAEMTLFGRGGHRPDMWRAHVRLNG